MEQSNLAIQNELTNEDIKKLIYTIKGKQKLPYVFTEKGILMLSVLLKNEIAIEVSIRIVESFVEMRKFISSNGQVFERLTNVEYKLLEHDKKFDEVFNQLQLEDNIKQRISYS